MALSNIEKVRLAIGDTQEPYVLTDVQIQGYLSENDDVISDTIDELRDIMVSYMASNNVEFQLGDLQENNRDRFEAYIKAMEKAENTKGKRATPIIGGASTASPFSIGMFDDG